MKKKRLENYAIASHIVLGSTCTNTMLCAVCKSDENVKFLTITDCNLCGKCKDELSESFEKAMAMDRDDYPEL